MNFEVNPNIQLIKKKKKKYGNNFDKIAELWSQRFGIDIKPEDVALALAELKTVRIEFDPSNFDSLQDRANYLWISNNYTEYLNL
jgi:hypothetical protein